MFNSLTESLLAHLTVGGRAAKRNLDDFLATLDILPYLEVEPAKLVTWPAHPTAIAKIRGGRWQTSALAIMADDRLTSSEGEAHFDIHFEVQVLQQQRRMSLHLHYETNPYLSQKKLYEQLEARTLESYMNRRNEFVAEFQSRCDVPGFVVRPSAVQIGKAEYDFRGRDPGEVARWMEKMIDDVACIVNETLYRLDERARFVAREDLVEPEPLAMTNDSCAGQDVFATFLGNDLSQEVLIDDAA